MPKIPDDIATQHARMVEVALLRGEYERALRAVDRAFEVARQADAGIGLESPVSDICSIKVTNCLESVGIETIGDLIQCSAQELLMVANIRNKSVDNLQFELGKLGLELRKTRCVNG